MATRVTATEVKEIFDTTLSDAQLDTFILAANLVVTEKLSTSGLSTAMLKEIERWLSAHLAAIRDQMPSQEKIGDASVRYQGETGMGLRFTSYGQQVMLLDTTGTLANSLGKKGAVIKHIGLA